MMDQYTSPAHRIHKWGLWKPIPLPITPFNMVTGDLLRPFPLPKVRTCAICGKVEIEK